MRTTTVVLRRKSKRPTILKLQREYLENGDEKVLDRFYRELFNLGFTIAKALDVPDAQIAIHDIASSVVIRLIEKREPVIKCAVSSYIRHALFFMGKPRREDDDIEDHEDIETLDSSPCDGVVDGILSDMGIDTGTELGNLVEMTLRSRVPWRRVWNKLDKGVFRDEYEQTMMEIYDHVKERMQGNGMSEV